MRRWIWAFENDDAAFGEVTHPDIEWAPFEENHTVSHGFDGAMRISERDALTAAAATAAGP